MRSTVFTRTTVVTAVVAVVAFVLGLVGFLQLGSTSIASAVYATLGLFTLNLSLPPGADESALPVALELARFLAPAVTIVAIGGVVAALFRSQLDALRARRHRGHVIVCGLGRVGLTAAERLDEAGRHVVAIERDLGCPGIVAARARRIPVVIGDATSGPTLARAGVGRASRLVWTAGEWVQGESVVERVKEQIDARGGLPGTAQPWAVPACLVRVRDLALCTALRSDVLAHRPTAAAPIAEVDYFNEAENAAQRVLWKVTRAFALATDAPVELWVLGTTGLAEALVVQVARNWWGSRARPDLLIRMFGEKADAAQARMTATWPELAGAGRLEAVNAPPEAAIAPAAARGAAAPDAAFVVVEGEERAIQIGLRLATQSDIPAVVVAATDLDTARIAHPRLTFFDPASYGLGGDVLLFDTYELLGRMIHEHYVLRHALQPDGELVSEDAWDADALETRREWNDLDPLWKLSNRRSAAFVVPNLLQEGLRIGSLSAAPDDAPGRWVPRDDPGRVEAMAEREHDRWRAFMGGEGFEDGPRCNSPRRRPALVPWSALDAETREYTCSQVREYPRLLAQLGFEIRRPSC